MDQVKVNYGARRQQPKAPAQASGKQKGKSTRKRARVVSDDEGDEEREAKRAKASDGGEGEGDEEKEGEGQGRKTAFQQPALITGATLKDYQLEGVAWMAGLHQNGISGILGESPCIMVLDVEVTYCAADEMGLGKVRIRSVITSLCSNGDAFVDHSNDSLPRVPSRAHPRALHGCLPARRA